MYNKTIVEVLRDKAHQLGYDFWYGLEDYQNNYGDYDKTKTIIFVNPIAAALNTDAQGRITDDPETFTTQLSIASHSDLSELYNDRYYKRLRFLKQSLVAYLKALACEGAGYNSVTISEFINKYDANFDGLTASLSFYKYGKWD